mmetsp:Transcript_4522/g.16767  ORF Transcript_4522/g.16767 Transcript_4522/m.16767 type:complete len:261 (-) Transcript_4522:1425-2207(-)
MGPSSTCSSGRKLCATPSACAFAFCHRRTICSATRASTSGALRLKPAAALSNTSPTLVAAAPMRAPKFLAPPVRGTPTFLETLLETLLDREGRPVSPVKPFDTSAAPPATAAKNKTFAAIGFSRIVRLNRARRPSRAARDMLNPPYAVPTTASARSPGTSPAPPAKITETVLETDRPASSSAASAFANRGLLSYRLQKRCTSFSSNHCPTVGTRSTLALSRNDGKSTSAIHRSASAMRPSVQSPEGECSVTNFSTDGSSA